VFVFQTECNRYSLRFLGCDDFAYGQYGETFSMERLGLASPLGPAGRWPLAAGRFVVHVHSRVRTSKASGSPRVPTKGD